MRSRVPAPLRFLLGGLLAMALSTTCTVRSLAQQPATIPHTTRPPVLDGILDEWSWRHAAVAADFRPANGRRTSAQPTEVRLLADHDRIFVGVVARDAEPRRIRADRWGSSAFDQDDDYVSLRLTPDSGPAIELFVNAGSARVGVAGGALLDDSEWDAAVERGPYGWSVELAVPAILLERTSPGRRWSIGAARYRPRGGEVTVLADLIRLDEAIRPRPPVSGATDPARAAAVRPSSATPAIQAQGMKAAAGVPPTAPPATAEEISQAAARLAGGDFPPAPDRSTPREADRAAAPRTAESLENPDTAGVVERPAGSAAEPGQDPGAFSTGRSVAASSASAVSAPAGAPPLGHTRRLEVADATEPPVIDGFLDEADWKRAPVAERFWVSDWNLPPTEPTEVRVLADETGLYVGFIAYERDASRISAFQQKRDASFGFDDAVAVELDPYHNHRLISTFSVNAIGTQRDAVAGGRARNIEWKGDWRAAVSRRTDAWIVEMAIPFEILNYDPALETIGINFRRFHNRTQETSRWADVTPRGLPEEAGHLTGLSLPPDGRQASRLTVMPYLAAGANAPDADGTIRDNVARGGVDVRYEATPNLTGVVSVLPDFSQVEEQIIDLAFDYNEVVAEERRPFFQEGSRFFGDRTYFFGGRVPDFDVGAKTFGRVGAYQLGLLGTQEFAGRRDYVGRLVREFTPTVDASMMLVGTERPDFDNRVVVLDAGGRIGRAIRLQAEGALSRTDGRPGDGSRLLLNAGYELTHWQTGVRLERSDAEFLPADGFIRSDRLGIRGASGFVSYGREFGSGGLRAASSSISYDLFDTTSGLLQRRQLSVYGEVETRADVLLSGGTTVGPYRPRAAGLGEWQPDVLDDRFYTASAFFNTRSDRYGYGLTYSWGYLSGADYARLAPSFWMRPLQELYLSYSYDRVELFGPQTQQIFSFGWDITPEQTLSGRWYRLDESYYRLAYRRAVRAGLDIFAVYDHDIFNPRQFTIKVVQSFRPPIF